MGYNLVQNKIFYEDANALSVIGSVSGLLPRAEQAFVTELLQFCQK